MSQRRSEPPAKRCQGLVRRRYALRRLMRDQARLSDAAIEVMLLYKTSGCQGSVHESASHAGKTGRIARALARRGQGRVHAPRRAAQSVRGHPPRGCRAGDECAAKPRQGSLGARVVEDRARLRGEGRRPRQGRRSRHRARRALHARLRRLPRRPLSDAEFAGKISGVPALAAHVPQGGEIFRPAAGDHRAAVRRRQKAHRLFATAARREQAAGGAALGRRRRLEGRSPAHRQGDDGAGPRLADHRHAGQRRESGALWRSVGRAHIPHLARLSAATRRDRRRQASASGAAASAPIGRRGSPTPPPTASRARCSTAAISITAFRRNGWSRPSPPAAPRTSSARTACSKRAAAPWAPRRSRNFSKPRRACR